MSPTSTPARRIMRSMRLATLLVALAASPVLADSAPAARPSTVRSTRAPAVSGARAPARRAARAPTVRATRSLPVVLPGGVDTTRIDEPELFMSWRAPYGMPGASDTMRVVSGDTTRVDTLYLSFDPGRDAPRFYALFARLYFHPRMGDTLGNYWHWEARSWNQGNLRMEFDNDGTFPCLQAFVNRGLGMPVYEYHSGLGKLDMIYAVKVEDVAPVARGTRYCFARILFRQKKSMLPGATQPVCVEWAEARLSFGDEAGDTITRNGVHRWVTMNAPNGGMCSDYKRNPVPAVWKPGAAPSANRRPGR